MNIDNVRTTSIANLDGDKYYEHRQQMRNEVEAKRRSIELRKLLKTHDISNKKMAAILGVSRHIADNYASHSNPASIPNCKLRVFRQYCRGIPAK